MGGHGSNLQQVWGKKTSQTIDSNGELKAINVEKRPNLEIHSTAEARGAQTSLYLKLEIKEPKRSLGRNQQLLVAE